MQRFEVIQPFLDLNKNSRYLEIGVEGGTTFHLINAEKKVAVDPIFRFNVPKNRITNSIEYHEITSDQYFGSISIDEKFDVIFVDGLHTNEQTTRDVLNAVEHLSANGVILIDDVIPSSYAASLEMQSDTAFYRELMELEKFDGDNWMGPVFRVVYFIAAFMQSFDYATIRENHGQTVMWRSIRSQPDCTDLTLEQIARMPFIDMLHRMEVLKVRPYPDILSHIASLAKMPK